MSFGGNDDPNDPFNLPPGPGHPPQVAEDEREEGQQVSYEELLYSPDIGSNELSLPACDEPQPHLQDREVAPQFPESGASDAQNNSFRHVENFDETREPEDRPEVPQVPLHGGSAVAHSAAGPRIGPNNNHPRRPRDNIPREPRPLNAPAIATYETINGVRTHIANFIIPHYIQRLPNGKWGDIRTTASGRPGNGQALDSNANHTNDQPTSSIGTNTYGHLQQPTNHRSRPNIPGQAITPLDGMQGVPDFPLDGNNYIAPMGQEFPSFQQSYTNQPSFFSEDGGILHFDHFVNEFDMTPRQAEEMGFFVAPPIPDLDGFRWEYVINILDGRYSSRRPADDYNHGQPPPSNIGFNGTPGVGGDFVGGPQPGQYDPHNRQGDEWEDWNNAPGMQHPGTALQYNPSFSPGPFQLIGHGGHYQGGKKVPTSETHGGRLNQPQRPTSRPVGSGRANDEPRRKKPKLLDNPNDEPSSSKGRKGKGPAHDPPVTEANPGHRGQRRTPVFTTHVRDTSNGSKHPEKNAEPPAGSDNRPNYLALNARERRALRVKANSMRTVREVGPNRKTAGNPDPRLPNWLYPDWRTRKTPAKKGPAKTRYKYMPQPMATEAELNEVRPEDPGRRKAFAMRDGTYAEGEEPRLRTRMTTRERDNLLRKRLEKGFDDKRTAGGRRRFFTKAEEEENDRKNEAAVKARAEKSRLALQKQKEQQKKNGEDPAGNDEIDSPLVESEGSEDEESGSEAAENGAPEDEESEGGEDDEESDAEDGAAGSEDDEEPDEDSNNEETERFIMDLEDSDDSDYQD